MSARILVPSLLLALSLAPRAHAGVMSEGGARLYGPEAWLPDTSGAEAAALPEGVSGHVPENDGEPFFLEVTPGAYSGRDGRSVRAALAEILPAVGWRGDVATLDIAEPVALGTPSEEAVRAELELDGREIEERLTRRFGELSDVTLRALELQAEENQELMLRRASAVRVRQVVDARPVRGLGLRVMVDEDGALVGITGALTDVDRLAGGVRYDAAGAERLAAAEIGASERVRDVSPAEALAVPTGTALRPAWRVEVESSVGRYYEVLVDAETGGILGVASLTDAAVGGQGRTFWPDPDGAAEVVGFEVDAAVNDTFTLTHADIGTVTSGGADGCMATAQVPDTNGFANFNVAPYTGLEVEDTASAAYNCNFQEINAWAQVSELLYWFEDSLGAEPSPAIPIRVNMGAACGDGANQACAGGGMLTFGIGTATLNGTTGAGNLWNSALDVTVVAHELGHHVTRRQVNVGGGTLTGSMSEGLSDYWSMAYTDTDTFGPYWGKTTGMAVQNGWIPRQAESQDVFPEHMVNNNEAHANGQMIAWAQLGFRNEMGERSALGAGLASRILTHALTGTGYGVNGVSGSRQEVYSSFQSLLGSLIVETGYHQARADLLQAYARAGIFATAHEAVIDISDDYLSPNDAPPTFTIWPGQDFTFTAAGSTSESSAWNPNYEVDLANDPDFTVNLVKSGTQTNISEAATGNTFGTWTPSAAQWAKLTQGSTLYYRVRTWDANGGKKRDSEHTLAQLIEVPTTVAVINGGGSAGCSTTGGAAYGPFALLLAALGLARRRQ